MASVGKDSLTDTIVEIHAFLADLTDIKRFELERDKAARLGKALANANQHIRIPVLNSRNAALAMLAWVACRIYLPMAKDVMAELSGAVPPSTAKAQAQPERIPSASAPVSVVQPGNVVPMTVDDAALNEWLPTVAN